MPDDAVEAVDVTGFADFEESDELELELLFESDELESPDEVEEEPFFESDELELSDESPDELDSVAFVVELLVDFDPDRASLR